MGNERITGNVLGAAIDVVELPAAVERILAWAHSHESRYVVAANVHVVVSASRDPAYRCVINGADMATPDGAPVAWLLRRQGFPNQARISGPDLMWALCERGGREGALVYLFGSTRSTLQTLVERLETAFPAMQIVGVESPPFRQMTEEEERATVERMNRSRAGIVFVGLGCPKQEQWICAHRGRVNAVMIGVGAAFDFHAGVVRRAPRWMQRHGLEWLHRLGSEPRRLWKRYLVTNALFIIGAMRQLLRRDLGV